MEWIMISVCHGHGCLLSEWLKRKTSSRVDLNLKSYRDCRTGSHPPSHPDPLHPDPNRSIWMYLDGAEKGTSQGWCMQAKSQIQHSPPHETPLDLFQYRITTIDFHPICFRNESNFHHHFHPITAQKQREEEITWPLSVWCLSWPMIWKEGQKLFSSSDRFSWDCLGYKPVNDLTFCVKSSLFIGKGGGVLRFPVCFSVASRGHILRIRRVSIWPQYKLKSCILWNSSRVKCWLIGNNNERSFKPHGHVRVPSPPQLVEVKIVNQYQGKAASLFWQIGLRKGIIPLPPSIKSQLRFIWFDQDLYGILFITIHCITSIISINRSSSSPQIVFI